MKLSEAKLRQIVREELVRDHKRKLKEVLGKHRQAASEELTGGQEGTPRKVAKAARQQRAAVIADIKRQFEEGDIDRNIQNELIKMTRDKTKLQIKGYKAEFQAAVLRSKEDAKQVAIDANEEEIQRLVDAGAPQRTAEDSVVAGLLAQIGAEQEEAEGQAAASVDIPTSILKTGKSGSEVETLQNWLTQAGFGPVEIDGKFGGATKAAVIAFQDDAELKQDGVVGPNTWKALAGKQGGGGAKPETANESKLTRKSFRNLISRELRRL